MTTARPDGPCPPFTPAIHRGRPYHRLAAAIRAETNCTWSSAYSVVQLGEQLYRIARAQPDGSVELTPDQIAAPEAQLLVVIFGPGNLGPKRAARLFAKLLLGEHSAELMLWCFRTSD